MLISDLAFELYIYIYIYSNTKTTSFPLYTTTWVDFYYGKTPEFHKENYGKTPELLEALWLTIC